MKFGKKQKDAFAKLCLNLAHIIFVTIVVAKLAAPETISVTSLIIGLFLFLILLIGIFFFNKEE